MFIFRENVSLCQPFYVDLKIYAKVKAARNLFQETETFWNNEAYDYVGNSVVSEQDCLCGTLLCIMKCLMN